MERYIGIDVHSTSSLCVVISPQGRKTHEAVVDTTARDLCAFVRSVKRPSIVVMEEGNQAEWLYEVLRPHADEVLVVQPDKSSGRKSDVLDAERRARLARLNEPGRLVYKSPRSLAGLRQATKTYLTTKKDLTRARARLKLLLQSRGCLAKAADLLDPDARNGWIQQLPEPQQRRAELLGAHIDVLMELHGDATSWMLEEARPVKAVRLLKSVPGIGDIRAPLIVSTMISPHRFRTKRQLWRYSGLAVDTRSSNDWERRGSRFVRRRGHELVLGLNRDRNPVLKEAFVGAAQQIINVMPGYPLHQGYQSRLDRGMKKSNARLWLARKIASIVLAIWKKKELYHAKLS